MKFKTNKLGLLGTHYKQIKIRGVDVEVRIVKKPRKYDDKMGLYPWFCAYAYIKVSSKTPELWNETYREKGWVGIDTAHYFNINQTKEEKYKSAINQIEGLIQSWEKYNKPLNKFKRWAFNILGGRFA